jgi:polysaccharide chain length determinant protein (PEP-CTERM system associated)
MIGQQELKFDDVLAILRRRWWIVVLCMVVGASVAYSLCRLLPKRYTSKTLVLIQPPTVPENYVQPVVTGSLDERLASMQEQILSRTRLQPVVEQFGLYQQDRGSVPIEGLVDRLRKAIEVEPIQPTPGTRSNDLPGFTVSVTLTNPQLAQQVCAQITSMFMEQNLRLRQNQAEDTTAFLGSQLRDAREKLDEHDAKLAAFELRYMGVLPDNENTNLNLLMSSTQQLDAVSQALSRAQQDKAFTQTMLTQQLEAWKASQAGKNPLTMQQQLSKLEDQLLDLKARYTDDYPDVIKLKSDIAQLEGKIRKVDAQNQKGTGTTAHEGGAINNLIEPPQIQQLRVQIHQDNVAIRQAQQQQQQLQKQIQTYQSRLQLSPTVQEQYKQLTRDHQAALDFYNSLLKKQKDSAIATDLERRQESEQFRVLDPANLPDKPSFPNPLRFYSGGLGGGLMLGLGMVGFLELRDKKLRTEQDVQHFLELPTLALIPSVKPMRASSTGNGKSNALPPAASGGLPSIRA